MTTDQGIRDAIDRVSFGPNLDWRWQVHHEAIDIGWRVRLSFVAADRDDARQVARHFGRWWLVEFGTTSDALAKTLFAAAKMIVEHELLEAFRFDDRLPFDPHRSVQDLTRPAC